MITDKGLNEDKNRLTSLILQVEVAIQQKQQELNQLQAQLMNLSGALDYIQGNISKPKEGDK